MSDNRIRFDDGAAYERLMGIWSRLVGEEFLDWVAPPPHARWIDVGCGNGAFTELVTARCAPDAILGVDPSEGQIAFARSRHAGGIARFERGDAMALPCADDCFDVAAMALVIFFVPEPERGVAEMRRVVRPGGTICAYAWDVLEPGGFPLSAMQEELRALSVTPMLPPRADASRIDALAALWNDAGLIDVRTRQFTVARTFDDFADFWATVEIALGMSDATRSLTTTQADALRSQLHRRLPPDASGRISYTARANAITGRVPDTKP